LDWLEQRTGIPVLGVVPHVEQLDIEAEDSVVLDRLPTPEKMTDDGLDVAIIRLPHISNFTDFDPLTAEPDVSIRYVLRLDQLQLPDIVILPGTKNTMEDMTFLAQSGLAEAIHRLVKNGCRLVGICGGYQMLGRTLSDPNGVESDQAEANGLGLLPLHTVFLQEKRTVRVSGQIACDTAEWAQWRGLSIEGYEIHMGQTEKLAPVQSLFQLNAGTDGAISDDGQVWGTYLHGIFHNDEFRRRWLDSVRVSKRLEPVRTILPLRDLRTNAFDRLADHVRAHLDMDKVYEILG
jgi:adenosylcobyric acid synthase